MPADTKVTPINKNKAKAAERRARGHARTSCPSARRSSAVLTWRFALVGLAVLMWFVYRYVGTLQVMGTGFIGTLLGGLILAAICYVIALIVTHLLHLHHRPLLAWIGRGIASGFRSLGSGIEKLLTGSYVWLERLAPVMLGAIAGWFGERFGKRDQRTSRRTRTRSRSTTTTSCWPASTTRSWTPGTRPASSWTTWSGRQLPSSPPTSAKRRQPASWPTPCAASDSLSAAYGDRVLVGSGNLRRTGVHLRLSGLPEDNEPADAPAPAETAAEPDGTADRTTDGDPMTTEAPARRTSAMFGGRTPFPEARALINLIEDANPADGDEGDHHDLVLGLGATMFRLAQAWESLLRALQARPASGSARER